jgi:nucleotide-binding universal stress UspA family protein
VATAVIAARPSAEPTWLAGLVTVGPRHVVLCYLGSAIRERVLREAAELCQVSGARLSLVLGIVDRAVPDGCCGIRGEQWRALATEATRDAAREVARLLDAFGCPPVNVEIEVGPSVDGIAASAAARYGCDTIAIGRRRRPWSRWGLELVAA